MIITIGLTKLLKLEVPQLAKLVLEIVEKHNPESLLIENVYNDFSLLKPEIESLIVGYGPHPLTPRLNELRQKRILYATSISFQVRGLTKGYIDGSENSVMTAKHAVDLYLYNLRANNEEIINERVDQFMEEIEANVELESAFMDLRLTPYIDELQSVHSTLKEVAAERNASISKRPKGVAPISAKLVCNGLRELFMRINSARLENKELDYTPLISELNEKLIRYKGLIKLRETVNSKEGNPTDDEIVEPTSMAS